MADYDILIIGGGMAGLSASVHAARLGYSTALLTAGVPGGELLKIEKIDGVPGHPDGIAGYDLCPMTQEEADGLGVIFLDGSCSALAPGGDVWSATYDGGEVSARAIVIATGTVPARLEVPGEDAFEGRGVSECASCDGPLLRGKTAVVAGGGDSAMQEALVLASHCDRVIMIEKSGQLGGQKVYRDAVTAESRIEVMTDSTVTAITGDGKVEAVTVAAPNGEQEIATAAVFKFVGLMPVTEFLDGVVERDGGGFISVDAALRSSARGVVAAGNTRVGSGWRAASAMGDGAVAAATLDCFLNTGEWRN